MVDTASWTVSGGLGVALCSAIDQLQNLGQVASPLWASVSSSFVTAMFTIRLGHFSRSLYAYPFISSLHMLTHVRTTHANTLTERHTWTHTCIHRALQAHVHMCTHTCEHRCAPLQPFESYPVQVPPPAFLGLLVSL